jgi:hypothetical protein
MKTRQQRNGPNTCCVVTAIPFGIYAELREARRVTADVEAAIERCVPFAPLHNPSNLTGIRVAR